jgi:hypothetical protein
VAVLGVDWRGLETPAHPKLDFARAIPVEDCQLISGFFVNSSTWADDSVPALAANEFCTLRVASWTPGESVPAVRPQQNQQLVIPITVRHMQSRAKATPRNWRSIRADFGAATGLRKLLPMARLFLGVALYQVPESVTHRGFP